jgi:hypothetical protein
MQVNEPNFSTWNAAASSPLQAGHSPLRGLRNTERTASIPSPEDDLAKSDSIEKGKQIEDRDANEKFLRQRRAVRNVNDTEAKDEQTDQESVTEDKVEMVDFQPPPSFEAWG